QDAVARRRDGVLVDVQLRELDAPARLRLKLPEDRLDGLARSAPGRPEIEHDRCLGLQDVPLERRVGYFEHEGMLTAQSCTVAPCAFWSRSPQSSSLS